ncbi:Uncharacterised protein [Streptococcus pneumoniae]|nr:Uncharacterised protein [Streptococcus pneumoniae]
MLSIAVLPLFFASSTLSLVVASSIAFLASFAAVSTSDFALSFSSCVKSVRLSISSFLALAAWSISFLASDFLSPVGLMLLLACLPLVFASSTLALVVALSIAFLAASAAVSTSDFALSFSSFVKSVRLSISAFLASAAWSIVSLEASVTLYLACTLSILPSSYVTVSSISWKPSVVG